MRGHAAAEILAMAQASRPLLAVVAVAFALVAMWLLVGQPQPQPPARSHTPLAPLQAIPKARDASAASDAANAQLQAAGAQVDSP
jgi:hypothetical protein